MLIEEKNQSVKLSTRSWWTSAHLIPMKITQFLLITYDDVFPFFSIALPLPTSSSHTKNRLRMMLNM